MLKELHSPVYIRSHAWSACVASPAISLTRCILGFSGTLGLIQNNSQFNLRQYMYGQLAQSEG
jgi:hypothetical protein